MASIINCLKRLCPNANFLLSSALKSTEKVIDWFSFIASLFTTPSHVSRVFVPDQLNIVPEVSDFRILHLNDYLTIMNLCQ